MNQVIDRGFFKLEEQSSSESSRTSREKIWTLTLNVSGEKVNKLSTKVMSQFKALLPELEALGSESKIDALILLSGKPGQFIAGADLELIQSVSSPEQAEELSREGQKLMDCWEDLSFPTVAAIEGPALGGGCEFSLASTAILMSNDPVARMGLPEVLLGLIPGMGGTIRLPRKIGLTGALDLILTGRTLNANQAYQIGLIEGSLPQQGFKDSVIQWTRKNLQSMKAGNRLAKVPKMPLLGEVGGSFRSFFEKSPIQSLILNQVQKRILAKTKGHYPAPFEILNVIRSTQVGYGEKLRGKARSLALEREAQGFGKVATTEISKNLIRLFFLTEKMKKSNGLQSGLLVPEHRIEKAVVLGAGVMGGGIAQLFAEKEISTRMKDVHLQALSAGIQSAAKIFKKNVKKRKLTQRQYLQKLNLIAPVMDYSGFSSVDVVVEAVVENMDLKKKLFAELEEKVQINCVMASNTSSLSISEMQVGLKYPDRLVGMHFFNPVSKMPLIEVIRGEKTSDSVVASIFQFSKKLGKTPIVVKDSPGFLVNRLLASYLNEAVYLVADGVSIPEIDRILLKFGMPMGPMELIDEVGVDVGQKVSQILYEAFGERLKPCSLNAKVVAAGRLGKKNGKGLYEYQGSQKTKVFDPKVEEIIEFKSSPSIFSEEEVLDRCLLPMINEAARCLEEEIVQSASEIDLGMIMGMGFPPFRGGLLRFADTLGIDTVVQRLKKYQAKSGVRFEPSIPLMKRAQNGQKFY